jgi:hypothetical protein
VAFHKPSPESSLRWRPNLGSYPILSKTNTGDLTDGSRPPLCLLLCHVAVAASHHPGDERGADLDLDLV